jgi:FemAB-related protein (PEP-CTERM system-associated)
MPSVAVIIVDAADADRQRWDEYVLRTPAATFFHRFGWRNVLSQAFGHRAHYLIAERDGRVVGVLPLGEIKSLLFGHSLISTPFCVVGGAVADDDAARDALIDAACKRARELGVAYLELRHSSRQRPDWPCKDSQYVTFRKAITESDEENLKAIPRKQRAVVRQGIEAGLVGRVDEKLDSLWSMYSESVRNLGTPVFSRRYFELLRTEFGADCEIMAVDSQGKTVSAVMSFYFRDEVLPYYGGGSVAARGAKANDFMYWSVMKRAAARGIRLFDYGRSKVGTGPYSFKKNWGFEPQPLHYEYYLVKAKEMPNVSPTNPKYSLMINVWRRMPLGLSRLLGPPIARNLG